MSVGVGRHALLVLVAACALALGAAVPAGAATVEPRGEGYSFEVLDDRAERNDLVVTVPRGGLRLIVEERGGAALVAGQRCWNRSAQVVECFDARGPRVDVDSGRGDDRVLIRAIARVGEIDVDGGSGDDRLDVGRGRGRLFGEAGRDVLSGAGGRDALYGGRGATDCSPGLATTT